MNEFQEKSEGVRNLQGKMLQGGGGVKGRLDFSGNSSILEVPFAPYSKILFLDFYLTFALINVRRKNLQDVISSKSQQQKSFFKPLSYNHISIMFVFISLF